MSEDLAVVSLALILPVTLRGKDGHCHHGTGHAQPSHYYRHTKKAASKGDVKSGEWGREVGGGGRTVLVTGTNSHAVTDFFKLEMKLSVLRG